MRRLPSGDARVCDPATFRILMGTSPDAFVEATLEELLPYGFGPENLGR